MRRETWKRREREVARDFGAERNPLSGSNSGHSESDSLHERLYIETKGRQKHAAVTLYDDTAVKAKREGKTPVVALWEPNRKKYLLLVDPDDLQSVAAEQNRGVTHDTRVCDRVRPACEDREQGAAVL